MTEQTQERQDTSNPKLPRCRLSTIAAIMALSPVPLMIAATILVDRNIELPEAVEIVLLVFAGSILICSPLVALAAKIRIALSDGHLGGLPWANTVLIGVSAITIYAGGVLISMPKDLGQRIVCRTNLKGLATALTVYAEGNDGRLPLAEQWCDLLITEADVSPRSFVCPASDAVEGESCYGINQYAAGKKLSELPANMVLLFEINTKAPDDRSLPYNDRQFIIKLPDLAKTHLVNEDRWNQSGGPEDLYSYHPSGADIAFVDGKSEFIVFDYPEDVAVPDLEAIIWDAEGSTHKIRDYVSLREIIEKPLPSFPKSVVLLGAFALAASLWITSYMQALRHWLFCLVLAIGAAGVGLIFSIWAQGVYSPDYFEIAGGITGAALGIMTAFCYVGILMRLQGRLVQKISIRRLASSLGIAAGMVASTLLHAVLMLLHEDHPGFVMMLVALPFGAIGGWILGILSGWIVLKFYRTKKPEMADVIV